MLLQFTQNPIIPVFVKPTWKATNYNLPSPVLCAWTAGIVDGEGHIGAYEKKTTRSIAAKVAISNTDFRMIKKLLDTWGGVVHKIEHNKNTNHKTGYSWHISTKQAYIFLRTIRCYLITKGEQADLAMELQERISHYNYAKRNRLYRQTGHNIPDEEYYARVAIKNKMRILNKVGTESEQPKLELLKELNSIQ